jgi:hypothetical protein
MLGRTMIKIQVIVNFNFIVEIPASITRVLNMEAASSPRISVTAFQLIWCQRQRLESSWLEYVFISNMQ